MLTRLLMDSNLCLDLGDEGHREAAYPAVLLHIGIGRCWAAGFQQVIDPVDRRLLWWSHRDCPFCALRDIPEAS